MTTINPRHDTTANARPYSPERDASLDATFDALSNRQCRDLLRHLADSDDGALGLTDLISRLTDDDHPDATDDETVAADDAERPGATDDGTGGETPASRLLARLHHTLLPKLADAELVAYDADRELVRYRPDSQFSAMRPTIESFESADLPVPLDVLFDLLADGRRRAAYFTLVTHEALSLPDLADEVAVAERGRTLSNIDPDDVLQVYLSLYHTHVPKLADAGVAEYEQEDDYVALTATGRALESPARALCDPSGD